MTDNEQRDRATTALSLVELAADMPAGRLRRDIIDAAADALGIPSGPQRRPILRQVLDVYFRPMDPRLFRTISGDR